jgi:hypothetical protein
LEVLVKRQRRSSPKSSTTPFGAASKPAKNATIKSRLAITATDYDDILTNAIKAITTRFDRETNRTLARAAATTHEFDPTDTQLLPPCYPIESVTKL